MHARRKHAPGQLSSSAPAYTLCAQLSVSVRRSKHCLQAAPWRLLSTFFMIPAYGSCAMIDALTLCSLFCRVALLSGWRQKADDGRRMPAMVKCQTHDVNCKCTPGLICLHHDRCSDILLAILQGGSLGRLAPKSRQRTQDASDGQAPEGGSLPLQTCTNLLAP